MISVAVAPLVAVIIAQAPIAEATPAHEPSPQEQATAAIEEEVGPTPAEILQLEQERNERLTVPVRIKGTADASDTFKGPFRFMVDTGSQATAITYRVNETLGLAPFGDAMLVAMASTRAVPVVRIDALTFGDQTTRDLVSPILNSRNVGADGILGLDSLQDLRVLLDFKDETIAVEDASDRRNHRRGFEIVVRARPELGQLLITDARVEGIKTTIIIDTGAQGSIGNLALKNRLRSKRAEETITTDVNGASIVGRMSVVRSLDIEGMGLRNVPLTFADSPVFEALGLSEKPVIALGMQHLRLFDRVAIDFSRRQVLFDVPRDVARAMRRLRSRGTRLPL